MCSQPCDRYFSGLDRTVIKDLMKGMRMNGFKGAFAMAVPAAMESTVCSHNHPLLLQIYSYLPYKMYTHHAYAISNLIMYIYIYRSEKYSRKLLEIGENKIYSFLIFKPNAERCCIYTDTVCMHACICSINKNKTFVLILFLIFIFI